MTPAPIAAVDLGRRDYDEVLTLQRDLCRRRVARETDRDLLLLVERDPVITLRRGTQATRLPIAVGLPQARRARWSATRSSTSPAGARTCTGTSAPWRGR